MAILVAIVVVSGASAGPAGAIRATGRPKAVEIATNHAKVEAFAYDGGPAQVTKTDSAEASDVSAFNQEAAVQDSEPDRAGSASSSQDTTVDTSEPLVTIVDSLSTVSVAYSDATPDEGLDPFGSGTSEFSISFEVIDAPTFFSVSGALTATADAANIDCTTVTVTSPDGTTFDVAAPSGCGAPESLSIVDGGKLQPGSYTFSVVADARASNPDALGGSADAFFDVGLDLGCSITGTSGADSLSGTADDDMICGLGANDTIEGLGGNDIIYAGPGDNVIRGGEGEDIILGDSGDDTILAGGGNDRIFDIGGSNIIQGGDGNDVILAGDGADQIVGDGQGCATASSPAGQNDDQLFGGAGNDDIFGCQGLDDVIGETGDDRINGGSGHDNLDGGKGSDKIHGDSGPDRIVGGTRKDVLFGDGENDKLFALDGVFDVVHGGSGTHDIAHFDIHDVVDGVEETFCCV
jgi:Ca2+-binding RTX toxin-like protein